MSDACNVFDRNRSRTAGILIASTKGSAGDREDAAGPALSRRLGDAGFVVEKLEVIADDEEAIASTIRDWTDRGGLDLIVTSGGTGLSPSDVTPEATRRVLEKEIPGLAEAIRAAGRAKTPHADLSRGLAGMRRRSLIVNLPGSPKGAMEGLNVVLPAVPHALDKIQGDPADCA